MGEDIHQRTKTTIPNKTEADKSEKNLNNIEIGEYTENTDLFDKELEKHLSGGVSPIHQEVGNSNSLWNIIDSFKTFLSKINIESTLLWLWCLGMLIMLGSIIMGYRKISIIKRKKVNDYDGRTSYIFSQYKEKLGIKRDIKVVFQDTIKTPALTAWFRPVMLLPMDIIKSCNDQELEFIITHDLNHYKRGDHLVRLLFTILKAIYWFNPIVHIGSSMMNDDMETACDAAVIEKMEITTRRMYAQTLISLFNTNNPIGSNGLAMSAGKSRISAEKRIRGLFMPRKTGMSVKTISFILAGVLALLCFTTACQPTPENEIVMNKGDGRLEEIIANKNEPSDHSIVKSQTTWTENVLNTDGETFLKIDASINVPTASKLPVIGIKPASFTQEQVDRVFEYFAQGKPVISGDSPLTKEEITEIILELKLDYAKFKKGDDGYDDHETAESFEQFINGYEKMLETAPDSHDYIDSVMLRIEPETMEEGVSVKIDTGKDEYALFTVSNPTSHYYSSYIAFSDGNGNKNMYSSRRDLYGKDANNLQTTIQQARDQAMKVLKELDLGDYHVLDMLTGISFREFVKNPLTT